MDTNDCNGINVRQWHVCCSSTSVAALLCIVTVLCASPLFAFDTTRGVSHEGAGDAMDSVDGYTALAHTCIHVLVLFGHVCSPAIRPEQDPTEQARTELNATLSRQRLLNTEIQTRKTRIKEIKEAQKRKNGGVGSGRPKGAKVTKSGAQIEEHRVEDEIRLLEKGILPWDKVLPGLRASGSLLSSARWIGMHVCTCV